MLAYVQSRCARAVYIQTVSVFIYVNLWIRNADVALVRLGGVCGLALRKRLRHR